MKAKLVLLMIVAAMGSTALVASAQSEKAKTYVIRSSDSGETVDVLGHLPVPPQPPVAPPPPAAARHRLFYSDRPQIAVTVEENNLSHQAEQLARQLAAAGSDSDREKIKGQLADLLDKQFDQRQKRHEEEIKQLEAQIKKLKSLVNKRQENRREIIARRLDQIVRESQGLGW